MRKPKPVVVSQVCDVCGEDWNLHPESPTVLDCVEILKRRPTVVYRQWWETFQDSNTVPCITPATFEGSTATTTFLSGGILPGSGHTLDTAGNVFPFKRPDDDDGLAGVRVPA